MMCSWRRLWKVTAFQTWLKRRRHIRFQDASSGCRVSKAQQDSHFGEVSVLRLSFANLFSGFMFDPVPKITTPDLVIDDFPEFAFTIGLNTRWSDANHASEKDVEAKLRQLARRIVASHQTSDRIIGFEVHGHADKTLRPPAGSSAEQTEKEVSQDRAENAKEMLLRMIEEEGGRPIIAGIKANSRARGFGATHRIFAPALN